MLSLLLKPVRFFSLLLLFLVSVSCSRQSTTYQITEAKGWLYEVNKDYGEDSLMNNFLKPYTDSLYKSIGKVISFSDQLMTKGFPEGLLGNFLTDIILDYTNNTLNLKADFCLQNNGGIRAALPSGPVTIRNMYEIMPFENELIIVEIDPRTMKDLLTYISVGEAVSVSGIRIIIHKNSRNEAFINNLPVDSTKTYLMATSDYLANGGSKMLFLKNCKRVSEPKIKIRDIEIAVLEQKNALNQHLTSKNDGRIQIVE